MSILLQDLCFGLRMLAKNPGFTAVAVLTLALGIGANTSIFTLFEALALRPLPVKDPSSVVNVYEKFQGEFSRQIHGSPNMVSYPEYVDYRDRSHVFSGLAAYADISLTLGGTDAETLHGLLVSCNYFSVVGAEVALGRAFVPEECQTSGTHPVAILNYGFWQRHFGSDPSILGKNISLNRQRLTIVGVAARDVRGTELTVPDIWIPLMIETQLMPDRNDIPLRDSGWLNVVGRLGPGISVRRAQAEMAVLARQSDKTYPGRETIAMVTPGTFMNSPEEREKGLPVAVAIMVAVGLVLLIACANASNLLLARAVTRQREIAVRLSLGATRSRLVKQLLTESVLIGVLSGAFGLLLAYWLSPVLFSAIPERGLEVNLSPDLVVFGYTLLVSLGTGVVFGLAPALQSTKPDLTSALKEEGTTFGGRLSASRLRDLLLVGQVSACLVLLIAAGLLVRALQRAEAIDPGFDMKNVLVTSLNLAQERYDEPRAAAFHRQLMERLEALPGVKSVSLAGTVPLTGKSSTTVEVEGREFAVNFNTVSPAYFQTLRIPIVRGRDFNEQDSQGKLLVAVISTSMARRFWPDEDPLGKQFTSGTSLYRIIGVVNDIRSMSLAEPDGPFFYGRTLASNHLDTKLLVRTGGNQQAVMAAISAAVHGLDKSVLISTRRMEEDLDEVLEPSRAGAMLSMTLGFLALMLASVGVYGVVTYAVSRRTHEIGVRISLGARQGDILRLVLRQEMRPVVVGIALGLAGAAALSRVLSGALYDLSPLDPVAFIGVSLFIVSVALLASYIPARRATKVDPMVALRHE